MTREKRFTLWAVGILVTAVLILVIGLWGLRQAAKAHYARVKREVVAAGAELSIAAFVPVVEAGKSNGREVLTAHLSGIPSSPGWLRHLCMEPIAPGRALVSTRVDRLPYEVEGGRFTNHVWNVLPQYVEPGRGSWVLLKQALTNDVIAFDLPYAEGGVLPKISHLAAFKSLFLWLQLAIVQDLQAGSRPDAMDAGVAGVDLIAMHDEPLLIAQLVRGWVFAVHVQSVWELLQRAPWTGEQLAVLQASLRKLSFADPLERALKMERAFMVRGFELVMERGHNGMPAGERLFVGLKDGVLSGDLGKVVDAGGEFAWWFAPGYFEAGGFLKAQVRDLRELRVAIDSQSAVRLPVGGVPGLRLHQLAGMHRVLETISRQMFGNESVRSLAIAAVALERYHLLSRRYPESLEELVPDLLEAVPVDWMDGNPLRYRKESDGDYRLWSIGTNGVDDGGVPSAAGVDWLQGDDVVWPRPASEAEVERHLKLQRARMNQHSP